MAKSGHRDVDRLEKLGCVDAPPLAETKVLTATELELKTLLLQIKRRAPRASRVEQTSEQSGENGEF